MASKNSAKRSSRKHTGRHRARRQPREPYLWLGASAITLGLGAAVVSGTAVAHADTTAGATGGQPSHTETASTSNSAPTAHPTATSEPKASANAGPADSTTDPANESAPRAPKTKPQPSVRKDTKPADTSTSKTTSTPTTNHAPAGTLAPSTTSVSPAISAMQPTAAIQPATATNPSPTSTGTTIPLTTKPAVATAPATALAGPPPTPTVTIAAAPVQQPGTAGAPTVPVQAAALLVAATAASTRQTTTAATAIATTTTGQSIRPIAATPPGASTDPTVIATIPVAGGVSVINPAGTRLYTVGGNSISVIDTTNNTVAATIPITHGADSLTLSPVGDRLYAANSYYNTVTVVDTSTNTTMTTIEVGKPFYFYHGAPPPVIVVPTENQVYVASAFGSTVSYIDPASNTVSKVISLQDIPQAMAISPDGKQLFVGTMKLSGGTWTPPGVTSAPSNEPSGAISVFDTATGNAVSTSSTPGIPSAMTFGANGTRLYVASSYNLLGPAASFLTTFDTASMTQIPVTTGTQYLGSAALPQGDVINGLAVSPDGAHLYLATSRQLAVFDTVANAVTTAIPFAPSVPTQWAVSPDGARVYLNLVTTTTTTTYSPNNPFGTTTTTSTSSLATVDTATNSVAGQPLTVPAGTLTMSPDGTRLYVANSSAVTVIDTGQPAFSPGGSTQPTLTSLTVADALSASMHALLESAVNAIGNAFYGIETTAINAVQGVQTLLTNAFLHPQPPSGPPEPTTAQGLYNRLRLTTDTSSGISIDKVTNGGKISYVVYLGGTQPTLDPGVEQNIENNVWSAVHGVKPAQLSAIINAITAKDGDPNAPIMLVGFSQGGIDAQNLAEEEPQLHVTSVVMFAAPLVYTSPSNRFTQIDLVATDDPVPGLTPLQQTGQQLHGHVYGPAIPSDYWYYKAQEIGVAINPFTGSAAKLKKEVQLALAYHGDNQTYSSIGYLFDQDGGYKNIKTSIANFSGAVTQTWPASGTAVITGGFA
ncbi:hypothetical protein [Mycolicibacterium sp. CBMA 226]|uniref:hypothetical protein n=1 Tax=Mycolicibacterium sp. CBMA 226 TaxID=2606611 RepID=UPI0012DBDE20|nr:hypothetical protein [Mycolicibacterium sp. CBMA 226]MUL78767.1 hypothetical protein [Mycolicibacterium sp. CBMA 226]QGW61059.1 PE-PGRS family protein PE_PGRS18 [Mycolicibacterium sp.]